MLERRRSYLLERLARTSSAIRTGLGRFDAYTKSVIEHGNETTERDISWIDRLIAHERATATGPGSATGPVPAAVSRDWAVSTAPTMPVPPADPQGGIAP